MPKKKNLRIAVTGPPAAGKSTVLKMFASYGVPTFSADEEVRQLSKPCQAGYHLIIRHLGIDFLLPDGRLNRKALLEALLKDAETKKTLEEIFHPLVRKRLFRWFKEHQEAPLLVAEIPLLYQVGWEELFNEILYITCPEKIIIKRLTKRLNNREIAQKLLSTYQNSKKIGSKKEAKIIKNEGNLEKLKKQIGKYYKSIMES